MWQTVVLALAATCASGQETLQLPAGAELIIGPVKTSFRCPLQYGYYADVDNDCKVFHVCNPVPQVLRVKMEKYSFICGNLTVFDQLSQTCTLPENAIPCRSAVDFFYLNERIGQEDALFHEAEDITKAGKLVPLYSRYSEAPTRNGRPAGKPLGFQGKAYYTNRDRSPASSIREDLNVTAINGKINRNRLYVPHNGGLLNIQKNPASKGRPANNGTRRRTTPSFGALPGYGNRLNLDVINFRDENFRVRRLNVNEGQDSREGVRGRARDGKKFVTSVERLPAASGQTVGKLVPVTKKHGREIPAEKVVPAPVVTPKSTKVDPAKQESTTTAPVENDTPAPKTATEFAKDMSLSADAAPTTTTPAPASASTAQTPSDQTQSNERKNSDDKSSQSKPTELVTKIKKTVPAKNRKTPTSSKSKTTKVAKLAAKSAVTPPPRTAATSKPVTPKSDTSTAAPASTSSGTSTESGNSTPSSPDGPPPSTSAAPHKTELTTTPASSTPASKVTTPDTSSSTTESPAVSVPASPMPTSEPKKSNVPKEIGDGATTAEVSTTSTTSPPQSPETSKAKNTSSATTTATTTAAATATTATATTTTTTVSPTTDKQTTSRPDATTKRTAKTDSPMIIVTIPPIPATSSTVTENQPLTTTDASDLNEAE